MLEVEDEEPEEEPDELEDESDDPLELLEPLSVDGFEPLPEDELRESVR